MSADAKAWTDNGYMWEAVHDGDCLTPEGHGRTGAGMVEVLTAVEACMGGKSLRWEIREYPDKQYGLVGYTW